MIVCEGRMCVVNLCRQALVLSWPSKNTAQNTAFWAIGRLHCELFSIKEKAPMKMLTLRSLILINRNIVSSFWCFDQHRQNVLHCHCMAMLVKVSYLICSEKVKWQYLLFLSNCKISCFNHLTVSQLNGEVMPSEMTLRAWEFIIVV